MHLLAREPQVERGYVTRDLLGAARAPPEVPEDVLRHRCLNYRYTSSGLLHRWQFVANGQGFGINAPGSFVTNDVDLLLEAALSGVGLACLLEAQAARHLATGALVRVLEAFCPVIPPNYLYYSNRRQVGAALRAFIDTVRDAAP